MIDINFKIGTTVWFTDTYRGILSFKICKILITHDQVRYSDGSDDFIEQHKLFDDKKNCLTNHVSSIIEDTKETINRILDDDYCKQVLGISLIDKLKIDAAMELNKLGVKGIDLN